MTWQPEIDLTYDVVPHHIDKNSSEVVLPTVTTTFNIQIPESIWEKHKNDEERLLEWAIDIALIPSLVNSFNQRHNQRHEE